MAAEHIKMVFPLMDDMAKTFQQGSQQLEQTKNEMKSIATTLSEGALLGSGGQAFTDAINSKLIPAISRLDDKFKELQQDVLTASQIMQQEDADVKGKFS